MSYFKDNLFSKASVLLERIADLSASKKIRRNYPEGINSLPEGFTVTYHSGALKTTDNTPESVIIALEHGAKVVEVDVTFWPDGTPCVIHAANPKFGAGVELSKILAEVAKSPDCQMNLDLKSRSNLPEVDRLVKEYGLFERVFYTGVFEDWVPDVRANSEIPYFLNYKTEKDRRNDPAYAQELADKIKSLGAIGLNTHYENATDCVTRVLHKNGLLISAWTANSISQQCRLLAMGVDNITTKRPLRLMRCIDALKKL